MDGFKDNLSQHFTSPQEIITANGQAEATQAEALQAEVRNLISTLDTKLNELKDISAQSANQATANEEYSAQLNDVGDKLESHIHKENVRVYRNVQASMTDELTKQTETLKEEFANQIKGINDKIDAMSKKQGGKAILPLQIIALLVVIGDLAINILRMLGML